MIVSVTPIGLPLTTDHKRNAEKWNSVSRNALDCASSLCITCQFPSRSNFDKHILVNLASLLFDTKGSSHLFLKPMKFQFLRTNTVTFQTFHLPKHYFDDFSVLEDALLACPKPVQIEVVLPGDIVRIKGTSQTLDQLLGSTILRQTHERRQLIVTRLIYVT